jgi:hypothetical protein
MRNIAPGALSTYLGYVLGVLFKAPLAKFLLQEKDAKHRTRSPKYLPRFVIGSSSVRHRFVIGSSPGPLRPLPGPP